MGILNRLLLALLLRQRYETELEAAIERLRQQAEIEIANP